MDLLLELLLELLLKLLLVLLLLLLPYVFHPVHLGQREATPYTYVISTYSSSRNNSTSTSSSSSSSSSFSSRSMDPYLHYDPYLLFCCEEYLFHVGVSTEDGLRK